MRQTRSVLGSALGFAAVLLAIMLIWNPMANANHLPANKIAVAGSGVDSMEVRLTQGAQSKTIELLRGTMKTAAPTDVVIAVTAECALITNISTMASEAMGSEAIASVKIWVELDGAPVPVSADDRSDTGRVVFCNRALKMVLQNFDDQDARIDTYLRTRAANAFNWVSLNLGSAVHTFVVKALLEANVNGMGEAAALVGKRTLVVSPEKLANDAEI